MGFQYRTFKTCAFKQAHKTHRREDHFWARFFLFSRSSGYALWLRARGGCAVRVMARESDLRLAVARVKAAHPDATARRVLDLLSIDAPELSVTLSDVKRACSKLAKAAAASSKAAAAASTPCRSSDEPKASTMQLPGARSPNRDLLDDELSAADRACIKSASASRAAALLQRAGAADAARLLSTVLFWMDSGEDLACAKLVEFTRAGGAEAAVHALSRFGADHEAVAIAGLSVIDMLCRDAPALRATGIKRKLHDAGATAAVVGAAREHHSLNSLLASLGAISSLTGSKEDGEDMGEYTRLVVDAGAYTSVLSALERLPNNETVCIEALRAVTNLSDAGPAPPGLLSAAVTALRSHRDSRDVRVKGLFALSNQVFHVRDPTAAGAMAARGWTAEAAGLAIDALNAYTADVEMCMRASMFLVNGLIAGFAEEITRSGPAKAAVRTSAAAHPRNVMLQDISNQILRLLKMHRSGELAPMIREAAAAGGAPMYSCVDVSTAAVAPKREPRVFGTPELGIEWTRTYMDAQALSGQRVRIIGSDELNGSFGKVEGVSEIKGMETLVVKLEGGRERFVCLPASSLQPCPPSEQPVQGLDLEVSELTVVDLNGGLPECQPDFSRLERCCSECGLPPPSGRSVWDTCANCGVTQYCCRAHQKAAWRRGGHRHTCGQPLPTPAGITVADTLRLLQGLREFGRACPQLVVHTFTELMQRSTGEGGVPLADSQLACLIEADGVHATAVIDAMRAFPELEGVQQSAMPLLGNIFCFGRRHVLAANGVATLVSGLDRVPTQVPPPPNPPCPCHATPCTALSPVSVLVRRPS